MVLMYLNTKEFILRKVASLYPAYPAYIQRFSVEQGFMK